MSHNAPSLSASRSLPTLENPLYLRGDAPVEAVNGVSGILAYLEEQTENITTLQALAARPVTYSARAMDGQLVLYSLLRRTLDQAAVTMSACE